MKQFVLTLDVKVKGKNEDEARLLATEILFGDIMQKFKVKSTKDVKK